MRIMVTGASGFVGRTLCDHLQRQGHEVTAVVRRPGSAPAGTTESLVANIGPDTDWTAAVRDQNAVVHLAARVHVMDDVAEDPLSNFRAVNTAGTLRLTEASVAAGVTSLIHLSSIKANGEGGPTPYTVDDIPAPVDPYGISKLEAENGLELLATGSTLHVTSIRVPLVYGPEVGGNFVRLLGLVRRGIPLPLAAAKNRRTMIAVWNLVDLIDHQLRPGPPGYELVIAGDADSLSTPALLRAIGRGLERPARLLWFPVLLLKVTGRLLRRGDEVQRLTGSLQVQIGSSRGEFTWEPPLRANEAIERTAREWSSARNRD